MHRLGTRRFTIGLAAFASAACGQTDAEVVTEKSPDDTIVLTQPENAPVIGLMTSLPIYWPLGTSLEQLASGQAQRPWTRIAIEQHYSIEPLDTLSPIEPLDAGSAEVDPLSGLDRLAVIQPRGLSPADNVALDSWVQNGGRLLLILDPVLTGHYHTPLGDPRRPVDTALVPPVVKRWGLEINFDTEQEPALREARFNLGHVWLSLPGSISRSPDAERACELFLDGAVARCQVGKGRVTLLADAASFEHAPSEVENSRASRVPLLTILDFAFGPDASR